MAVPIGVAVGPGEVDQTVVGIFGIIRTTTSVIMIALRKLSIVDKP